MHSFTGKKLRSLNLGSYNYLGFAQNDGPVLEEYIYTNTTLYYCNSHFDFNYLLRLLEDLMLVIVPAQLREVCQHCQHPLIYSIFIHSLLFIFFKDISRFTKNSNKQLQSSLERKVLLFLRWAMLPIPLPSLLLLKR